MDSRVDVLIPVDAEAAQALQSAEQREAMGRLISQVIRQRSVEALATEIAALKREAHANGLTDEDVDEELKAWRAERRA